MATQSVRINEASHRVLQELARAEGRSMQSVLDQAVQEYLQKRFWQRTNAAFRKLAADKRAWKQELQERQSWDHALMDGVDPE